MGRRIENGLTISDYTNTLDDTYLIGYYNKRPVVVGISCLSDMIYLRNGDRAMQDQNLIYKAEGRKDRVQCHQRILLETPLIYYGFKDMADRTSRSEEAKKQNEYRRLSKKYSSKEVDRLLYGDEIFCIVAPFYECDTKKVYVEALGCIKRKDGTVERINQKICESTLKNRSRICAHATKSLCLGLSERRYYREKTDYLEWTLPKANIGKPVIEVGNKAYRLDFEEKAEWVDYIIDETEYTTEPEIIEEDEDEEDEYTNV